MSARAMLVLALVAPTAAADPLLFTRIAQSTDAAPNNFGTFSGFPAASPTGAASFTATAAGVTSVYSGNGTALTTVATPGTAIPGGGAATFADFGASTGYGPQGVVFRGTNAVSSPTIEGVYLSNAGTVSVVADRTTAAPANAGGTGTPGNFSAFASAQVYGTTAAAVGFRANYAAGTGSYAAAGTGAYVKTTAGIQTLLDTTMTIPGGTGTFSSFGGNVALGGTYATFRASGAASQQGIYFRDFSNAANPLLVVTDKNSVLPGTASTVVTTIGTESVVSGNKVSAVVSAGAGTVRLAQYAYDGAGGFTPSVAVKYGDAVPGQPTATFTNFSVFLSASNGRTAFFGTSLDGATTRYGIYTYDDTNGVQRVIDTSQTLDGKTFNNATTALSFGTDALNGNSLAFYATFADGSKGAYVATLAPVPEPATVLGIGAAALGLMRLRKRWRASGAGSARRV